MNKTDLIQVRIDPESKDQFTKAARASGLSRAQAIRGFIDCVTIAGRVPDAVMTAVAQSKAKTDDA